MKLEYPSYEETGKVKAEKNILLVEISLGKDNASIEFNEGKGNTLKKTCQSEKWRYTFHAA